MEDKKMKRRLFAVLMGLVMIFSLTACGAAKSDAAMDMMAPSGGAIANREEMKAESSTGYYDYVADAVAPMEPSYAEKPMEDSSMSSTYAGDSLGPAVQKLIRTAWLEMEATEFDEAAKGLAQLTETYGGYYQTSTVTNRGNGSRWGNYVIRIPADQYTAFLNQAGELCHLTRQESNQEDISQVYYDTAGRLKTQQIKLERLQNLRAKAEDMKDIITIESAISETEWQIDNLSGTLRHYDSKVDYATVNVTLQEVYKLSNVETVPATFGERLGDAFIDGISDFLDDLEDLAVDFAYSWIWWLIVVVIAVVVIRGLRKNLRKRREQKRAKAEAKAAEKNDEN